METKKAITIGVIVVILMATAAVFAFKIAKKNSTVSSPKSIKTSKPVNTTQLKIAEQAKQKAAQTDSDVAGIEADLNSVSEEDFSDSSLSDSAVGL